MRATALGPARVTAPTGPVFCLFANYSKTGLRMPLRLDAFNFFERGLKRIIILAMRRPFKYSERKGENQRRSMRSLRRILRDYAINFAQVQDVDGSTDLLRQKRGLQGRLE